MAEQLNRCWFICQAVYSCSHSCFKNPENDVFATGTHEFDNITVNIRMRGANLHYSSASITDYLGPMFSLVRMYKWSKIYIGSLHFFWV